MYFLVGIFLILLQSTFLHLLPFGPVVPDLVLVLCVYLGLHHPTVGAAVGSFALGYSVDVVSSRLLGLNAFAMTLVCLSVYLSSRTIWLHHPVVSSMIVLFAAIVKGLALVLVWVGIKMALKVDLLYIPTWLSLLVIITILTASVVTSLRATRGQGRRAPAAPSAAPFRTATDEEMAQVEPLWRRRRPPADTPSGPR